MGGAPVMGRPAEVPLTHCRTAAVLPIRPAPPLPPQRPKPIYLSQAAGDTNGSFNRGHADQTALWEISSSIYIVEE